MKNLAEEADNLENKLVGLDVPRRELNKKFFELRDEYKNIKATFVSYLTWLNRVYTDLLKIETEKWKDEYQYVGSFELWDE